VWTASRRSILGQSRHGTSMLEPEKRFRNQTTAGDRIGDEKGLWSSRSNLRRSWVNPCSPPWTCISGSVGITVEAAVLSLVHQSLDQIGIQIWTGITTLRYMTVHFAGSIVYRTWYLLRTVAPRQPRIGRKCAVNLGTVWARNVNLKAGRAEPDTNNARDQLRQRIFDI
jgi:hypothetical protein